MSDIYKEREVEYKGYHYEIVQDSDPEDPRSWDNVGVMVCWHNRYNLGDEQPKSSPEEWLEELAGVDTDIEDYKFNRDKLVKLIEAKGILILPLGLYNHSELSIYIGRRHWQDSAGWDSGQVGWIYVTKEQIEEEWQGDYQKAEKYLEGEVETYNDYLRNNVWGWRVIETGESVWGYYGQSGIEDACKEAESSIDWEIKSKIKTHLYQLKQWIKSKVPVIYRKPLQLV